MSVVGTYISSLDISQVQSFFSGAYIDLYCSDRRFLPSLEIEKRYEYMMVGVLLLFDFVCVCNKYVL